MKRLNIPLLVALIVGFLVLAVGTHFLHGYQMARNAESLRTRAEEAGAEGDVEEQIRILQRYLRYRPDDIKQLKVLLRAGKERTLSHESVNVRDLVIQYNALEKAIREHPEDVELRRLGCEFALHPRVQRITDVLDHLEQIEANGELTSSDKVTRARCLEVTEQPAKAIQLLSQMIGYDAASNTFRDDLGSDEDKKEVDAYVNLVQMMKRASAVDLDVNVASKIMNRMVEVNSTSTDAYLQRASFYQTFFTGREGAEKSMDDINRALELDAQSEVKEPRVKLAAAVTLMSLGNLDQAESILKEALAEHPDERRLYSALADLATRRGDNQLAKEYVQQGLNRLSLNPELLYQRANIELGFDQVKDCEKTVTRLEEQGFDIRRVELLKSRIMMHQGDYVSASKKLERLRPMMQGAPSLSRQVDENLMLCYKRLGFTDKIPELVERLGGRANALFELAQSHAAQGRYNEALETLAQLRNSDAELSPEGKRAVFKLTMDLHVLREQRKPESQRNWDIVDRMAEKWLETEAMRPEQQEDFRIGLLVRKGKREEALQRTREAVRRYEGYATFWMYLNSLTPDPEQALTILDQMESRFGDSWTLRAARANRLVSSGRENVTDDLAKLLEGIDQFSLKDQTNLKTIVANSYAQLEEYDRAIGLLRELLATDENSLALRTSIFEMAYNSGNAQVMDEMLADFEQMSGRDSTEWQIARSRRLLWSYDQGEADKDDLREVKDLVERAGERRPSWAPIDVLRADVFIREGNLDGAAVALTSALEKRPGDAVTMKQLASVYGRLGRTDEAKRLLSQLPDSAKDRTDVLKEIQILASQDPQAALRRAEEAISGDSTSAAELLFLADVRILAGETKKGFEALRRAIEVEPQNTSPWMRYVQQLIMAGETDKARQLIPEMQAKVPADRHPLLFGQCYSLLGDYAKAEASYVDGLKETPDDPVLLRNLVLLYQTADPSKVEPVLNRMVSMKGDDPETNNSAAWARREMAKRIADSMGYNDFLRAIQLLEQNADDNGDLHGPDLELWLRMCAYRPEAPSRQRAVERLNQIREKRTLSNGEKAVLAYLYKTDDRWSDAKQVMLDVMANNPNPAHVNLYVQWLIEANELRDAAAFVRKLPPNSMDFVRFQSILLVKSGQSQDAARRLNEISKRSTAATADNVRNVALIMEELGADDERFYKAAEQQWVKYVRLRPSAATQYVHFLMRVPQARRLGHALSICEKRINKALQDQDMEQLKLYIELGLRGLRANRDDLPTDSEHYVRVQNWFNAVRQANLTDLQMEWKEINFHDIRRDIQKLDTMYRDFLTRSDATEMQKAIVRNNLAFQLAISNRGREALEVIGDAISQLGPRSDFLDTRALAHLTSGDVNRALDDLRLALDSGDATPAMYFHYALALNTAQRADEAASALKRALDMGLTETDLTGPEIKLFRELQDQLGPRIQALRDRDVQVR